MLATVAVTAALSFALYAALIALWSPDIRAGQDQESDIAITVEHFLYGGAVPATAILGSSQAARIPASALGPDTANLALAGKNPLIGIAIIARSGRVPRRLYVETNKLAEPVDTAFVEAAFAEPGYILKRYVKALRTTYQPANVLIALLRRAARGRDDLFYPALADPPLHETLLARQQRLLAAPPDSVVLQQNLAALQRFAVQLAAQGVELVFFEMPIDPALEQTRDVIAVRQAVQAAFPPDRTCWNDPAAPKGAFAMDGIHLDSEAAAGFWTGLAKTICPPARR
jgi:hypothetical protein